MSSEEWASFDYLSRSVELTKKLREAERRLAIAVAALEFYAVGKHFDSDVRWDGEDERWVETIEDRGEHAKEALAKITAPAVEEGG